MIEKTNACRQLDQARIAYTLHGYETDGTAVDAIEVARRLDQPIDKVYKTLVTQGASRKVVVMVINGADELDLKKAALAVGEKNLQMIPMASLLDVTGYVRGGCSPIGMKKPFKTVFDDKIKALDTVIVSAGKIGTQIELSPNDLIAMVKGQIADVVKNGPSD